MKIVQAMATGAKITNTPIMILAADITMIETVAIRAATRSASMGTRRTRARMTRLAELACSEAVGGGKMGGIFWGVFAPCFFGGVGGELRDSVEPDV